MPDTCDDVPYRLQHVNTEGKGFWKRYVSGGCHTAARFEVAYDPTQPVRMQLSDTARIDHPGELSAGERKVATVCAVCDDMGRWPRFAKELYPR